MIYDSKETHLQPLSREHMSLLTANTDANAHSDIAADGVWGGRFERSYFDVQVFNPFAQSNLQIPLDAIYRRHKLDKIHQYAQRVREVEHSSFTPSIFFSSGGWVRLLLLFISELPLCWQRRSTFLLVCQCD